MPDAAWRHWKPHYRDSRCLTGQIRSERFALPTLQFGLLGFRLSSLFHLSFLFCFGLTDKRYKPLASRRNHSVRNYSERMSHLISEAPPSTPISSPLRRNPV